MSRRPELRHDVSIVFTDEVAWQALGEPPFQLTSHGRVALQLLHDEGAEQHLAAGILGAFGLAFLRLELAHALVGFGDALTLGGEALGEGTTSHINAPCCRSCHPQ